MDETIKSYFPDLDQREKKSWILRPFSSELENVIEDTDTNAKIEFLSLREDIALKVDYQEQELCSFWGKLGNEYPILSERALKVLIPFATTYRCEVGFSTMVVIKTKARNRMIDINNDIRCALINSHWFMIAKIIKKKQFQVSL